MVITCDNIKESEYEEGMKTGVEISSPAFSRAKRSFCI
jgi:hypothetical protein